MKTLCKCSRVVTCGYEETDVPKTALYIYIYIYIRCKRAENYTELFAGLIFLWLTYNLYFWNAAFDINFPEMTGDAFFLLVHQINRNNRSECLSTKIVYIGCTFSSEILFERDHPVVYYEICIMYRVYTKEWRGFKS